MKDLHYQRLEMQEYLKTNELSLIEKKLLFKFRTRMVEVGHNFGRKVQCPVCFIAPDNQQHLLSCVRIKVSVPEIFKNTQSKYEDIFSNNIKKMKKVIQLLELAIRKREELKNVK